MPLPLVPSTRGARRAATYGCAALGLAVAGCATRAVPALRFTEAPAAPTDDARTVPQPVPTGVHLPEPVDRAGYLARLRQEYRLDSVVAGSGSDLDRVRRMSRWARRQWEHNGENEPAHPDPLAILAEARSGKRFRCVEYAEVLAAGLSAIGVPARVLGLQRADVETARTGAGHVVAEAYLADRGRWVLVDGQWDVIPFRGAEPLNAVELQRALADRAPDLRVESLSGTGTGRYARWVAPYLFYFVARPRTWTTGGPPGPRSLMLVPLGADAPRLFQQRWPQPPYLATSSTTVFYAPPSPGT